jgi:hypothetical protein
VSPTRSEWHGNCWSKSTAQALFSKDGLDFCDRASGAEERSHDKAYQAATSDDLIVECLSSAAFASKMDRHRRTVDKDAAIEKAAELFKASDPRKTITVHRR